VRHGWLIENFKPEKRLTKYISVVNSWLKLWYNRIGVARTCLPKPFHVYIVKFLVKIICLISCPHPSCHINDGVDPKWKCALEGHSSKVREAHMSVAAYGVNFIVGQWWGSHESEPYLPAWQHVINNLSQLLKHKIQWETIEMESPHWHELPIKHRIDWPPYSRSKRRGPIDLSHSFSIVRLRWAECTSL
jgi:hypothetical protein